MQGVTDSGFKFNVHDKVLNNMELVEAIAEVDTNPLRLPGLLTMLLGDEQKKKLYDHVRIKDGSVPMDKVAAEVVAILHSIGEKQKN